MKTVCIGLALTHSFAYLRGILRGIRRYLETKPQWLVTSLDPEQPAMLGRLRPDGVIASVNTTRLVQTLSRWRQPVVNVSVVFPGLRFPRVGPDNEQVGQLAADHFLERGLRQFGYIGPSDHLYSIERRAAFCRAVQEAGYTVACYDVQGRLPFDRLGSRWDLDPGVRRWLRKLPKPTGVFIPNDLWGVQVGEACRQSELRVPEDVALLGVGNDDLYCEMTRPPLSSIIVPAEQIGYEATALLERLLGGEKPPREPILLSPVGVATRRSTEVLAIDDPEVVAAVRFIRENSHLPLRVTDVLGLVPVGRRTLEQRFHKALGWGLGAEIRRTHLERARRLLAKTDLPLKVLATEAGFSDYRHLNTVFKQELSMTPTDYRRQLRSPAG